MTSYYYTNIHTTKVQCRKLKSIALILFVKWKILISIKIFLAVLTQIRIVSVDHQSIPISIHPSMYVNCFEIVALL